MLAEKERIMHDMVPKKEHGLWNEAELGYKD